MDISIQHFMREFPFRDGSRIDLIYFRSGRIVGFEMKMADSGEAAHALSGRDLRQLRHFGAACNAIYLVTLASPRSWGFTHDGHVVNLEPLERQLLPDGVGWIAFDALTHDSHVLVPAPERKVVDSDRIYLVEQMEARLGTLMREAQRCR